MDFNILTEDESDGVILPDPQHFIGPANVSPFPALQKHKKHSFQLAKSTEKSRSGKDGGPYYKQLKENLDRITKAKTPTKKKLIEKKEKKRSKKTSWF